MPSPFPGMDPFLEGSEWTSFHTELSSEIARQLAPKLRPKYVARTTRRFVTETPDDVVITTGDLYPDVSVIQSQPSNAVKTAGTVAMAPPPLQLATVIPARVPHITVEIRDTANRTLVTAIEILSPANKRGDGYREYIEKRQRLLYSPAHLVEIDLLRLGQRVPMQQALPSAPYFVFLSRAGKRPVVDVWAIQLNMRLPAVPVPLLAGDPDVILDLQTALDAVYDALSYDLSVDYSRPPEVALKGEFGAWATERLKAAGKIPPHS
ncbi:MAG: DUF4058 family protein [Planctomycetes bacterium]|nr:DUF4058 family protein [Planctomycetota bacterium]